MNLPLLLTEKILFSLRSSANDGRVFRAKYCAVKRTNPPLPTEKPKQKYRRSRLKRGVFRKSKTKLQRKAPKYPLPP